jgi:hypothetical protein
MLVSAMLKSADNCQFDLDFAPRSPTPPILPTFVWKNQALNHFSGQGLGLQDVSDSPLASVLPQIYPSLSFAELAEFYHKTKRIGLAAEPEALFAAYRFRWDGRLEKILAAFCALPTEFKNWCAEHELSPRDLSPIISLSKPDMLQELYLVLAQERVGRNQGAQILELAAELMLMDHAWEQIAPPLARSSGWIDSWLVRLKTLRFPVTSSRDDDQQAQLAELPWSKDFSTKWIRSGDKSGLEVKFLLTSKNDLQKKLEALSRVHEGWRE